MNYTIVITQNDSTIFSGHFVVTNTSITEFYENGNKTNILAPTGSYGGNNNVFGSITSPFSDNGVNITTMSYYLGNYGENVDDGTYNLYSFSENNGFLANFNGVYHFTIAIDNQVIPIPDVPVAIDPIPSNPVILRESVPANVYYIAIRLDGNTIFSGEFLVTNTSITEFYENGNDTNILAPVGSYGGNDNIFGSITDSFSNNGVNITSMSYYDGNYGENVTPPGDGTYNLYEFISGIGGILNFTGTPYEYIISSEPPPPPLPGHYKINILITLETTIIFTGFFVVNNYAYPNIIGFYENGSETTNILAPVGSYGGNNNVFNTLTNPFTANGVNITTMSYYAGDYGNNVTPPGDGTYNLYSFTNVIGYIRNFSNNSYTFTTILANPADPIPLYPPAPRPPPPIPPPVPPPIDNPVTYIVCQPCQKSRFCYNYKPPGIIEPCCTPIVCATDALIASLSALPEVVNNSSRTTESSLLQATVRKQQLCNLTKTTNSTIQSTIANAAAINENIFNQLINIRDQRYAPYQPYIYPVVPPSVMELQMRTANVGVPHTVNTIANCRGSQFVTT
jgi:hypothetical protein